MVLHLSYAPPPPSGPTQKRNVNSPKWNMSLLELRTICWTIVEYSFENWKYGLCVANFHNIKYLWSFHNHQQIVVVTMPIRRYRCLVHLAYRTSLRCNCWSCYPQNGSTPIGAMGHHQGSERNWVFTLAPPFTYATSPRQLGAIAFISTVASTFSVALTTPKTCQYMRRTSEKLASSRRHQVVDQLVACLQWHWPAQTFS